MRSAAAGTAIGPMVIVAAEQHETLPLLVDPWAARLLPPAVRLAAASTRWAPLRGAIIAAAEKKIPGIWAAIACRKRYIDDRLLAAFDEGIDAVLILGAGFDSRACRLPQLAHIPVWEVDLPDNIAAKSKALQRCFGSPPDNIRLTAVDFETDDLADALRRDGFEPGMRTFIIWEAVTQYLTEWAVRQTLSHLCDPGPGSHLALTYVRKDFLDGHEMYGAEAGHHELVVAKQLWRFGLEPEQTVGFFAEYGWQEYGQAGSDEYSHLYVRPCGRAMDISPIERSLAARR
ncbi:MULTISPECIES: SAM-dependent methyltransferase [Mycobacteroides]|nr:MULTISPECIES: SAM-dependent methyltransferase [Mycobacteroides]VEG15148.1 O-methyltransferase [Mycolicibacterium phlei]ANA97166.1 methyltransferase [Mycobacteroides chelonae CCUG 47445]MEC4838396.1 SAM-dependent methyltransferase [Mycobacteroides chelonae]MEC4845511.1 SAM-dependent methyltransferase [Mycobacteroides chelonae]WED90323.1 SAM-dependent methyltransferase [Mycobacteroides chelonae]